MSVVCRNTFIVILFCFVRVSAFTQIDNFVELNGGGMHYVSEQNNRLVNPTIGVNWNIQITEYGAMELYYNAAFIDETVVYLNKGGSSITKNERFVNGWLGVRGVFGKNAENWSLNAFFGASLRFDKGVPSLETGLRYGHHLFGGFWLNTTAFVQADRYLFREPEGYDSYPLDAGMFTHAKLGLAYHFN